MTDAPMLAARPVRSARHPSVGQAGHAFRKAGYSLLPGLLTRSTLSTLQTMVAARAHIPVHEGMSRPGSDLHPLRWNDDVVARILSEAGLFDRLDAVVGVKRLDWLSAYISSKRPGSPRLPWHQDWWCWDDPISLRETPPHVALLCYLSDCDSSSGALRVIPGSHARSTDLHPFLPDPHSNHSPPSSCDDPAIADHPAEITMDVSAGDAVLIDYRLLHGSHRNDGPFRRDCILLSFLPEPEQLPPRLKAHLAMHPALPQRSEQTTARESKYHGKLARFSEKPESLAISRRPPLPFAQVQLRDD